MISPNTATQPARLQGGPARAQVLSAAGASERHGPSQAGGPPFSTGGSSLCSASEHQTPWPRYPSWPTLAPYPCLRTLPPASPSPLLALQLPPPPHGQPRSPPPCPRRS